jgi:hypothetical protein
VRSIPKPRTACTRCARLNMRGVIPGAGNRRTGGESGAVRAVFVLYLVLIASGIAFYMVIGLTHN